MTTILLTTGLVAALAGLAVVLATLIRERRERRQADDVVDLLSEQRDEDGALIAQLFREAQFSEAEISHKDARIRQLTADLCEAKREGELAARAGLEILARERDQFVESIRSWQIIAAAAMLAEPRALTPPAPQPPKALPSGDFLVDDEDGPVILQLEEFEPLPAGTNGTGA